MKKFTEPNIFVVLNSHLLSEYHRLHVASNTVLSGFRLVLVWPLFNPEALTLRIKIEASSLLLIVFSFFLFIHYIKLITFFCKLTGEVLAPNT